MSRKALLTGAVLAVFGLLMVTGVSTINAMGVQDSGFISTIATKLGVSEDKVSTAWREAKQDRYSDRLSQLVKDGKITEAQKTLIMGKHKEIQDRHEKERTELELWAKSNNIDSQYLMGFGHGMRNKMMH